MTILILVGLGLFALRALGPVLKKYFPLIALVGLVAGLAMLAPGSFGSAVSGLVGPALLVGLTGFGLWWMLKGLVR